jgi:multicomponent K+:H+ antiporter subunit D
MRAAWLFEMATTAAEAATASHLLVVPVLLPLVAAGVTLRCRPLAWQRALTFGTMGVLLLTAARLVLAADAGEIGVYRLGDWSVPVGIVLVLDRLSALLLALTAVVAAASAWQAIGGADREGPHFHALFLLLVAGLNGAFLAGDLFNLFVSFEILLIASYGLLAFGATRARLRAGVHYVVLNLVGSSLFLVGIGLLYAVTGTLNMADLAARIAAAPAADAVLLRSGAALLLVVFALKAALVPLSFWLPAAYTAASPSVAALFALMTKVGVYAIVRTGALLFGPDAGVAADAFAPWLLPASLATIAVGALTALAAREMRRLLSALLLASVGTMLIGVALASEQALAAALFYLVHSTVAAAFLFVVAGLTEQRRDRQVVVGSLFFVGAVASAGVPPLSGFIGKVLILQAAAGGSAAPWLWGTILGASALAVLALSRRGAAVYWAGEAPVVGAAHRAPGAEPSLLPASALLVALLALTAFAGPATGFAARTAAQVLQPADYIASVLGSPGGR